MDLHCLLPLQEDQAIFLQGGATGSSADLGGLNRLLDLQSGTAAAGTVPHVEVLPAEPPAPEAGVYSLYRQEKLETVYDRRQKTFRMFLLSDAIRDSVPSTGNVWRYAIAYGVLAAAFRGQRVTLVHCSLLETPRGAVMICGESGVGKSTTARRFREAGGSCIADDMILLEAAADGFYCRPLPTWSACQTSLTDKVYPFGRSCRLAGVLGLARGAEREELLPISQDEFFAQIYRAMYYFLLDFVRYLRPEEQELITRHVQELAVSVAGAFPARGLFAHLEGDLTQSLKEFL